MPPSITVLHVDDDPDFVELSAEFLERESDAFEVVTETRVEAAIARFEEERFDCVVSDYDMPEMDGLEFLREIRTVDEEFPFILFTGKGSEEVASVAFSAGATDYLQKESGTDQYTVLANRIRNAVERFEARRQQKRQLDAIETAQEGISILDEDGRYIYVNEAYADLYRYEPAEMLGEHWQLIYPDDELGFAREEVLQTVEAQGYWRGETTGLRADGTTFPEDHVVASAGQGGLICTVRDKSEWKERERELELKDRAMDAAPTGIVITDPSQPDNPIVYANEHFLELTGYDRESVLGRNCRLLQGENTDEKPVAAMREHVDSTEPVTAELRNYRENGSEFWNQVRISPIRNDAGEVTNYVGFQQDVTDRKEREKRIEKLHETSQELMAATASDDVVDIAVEAADEVLGLELSGFHAPTDEGDALGAVAVTDESRVFFGGDPPDIERGDSLAWRAYESGETFFLSDVRTHPDAQNPDTRMRSEMILPVGEHGVFLSSSREPDAFDGTDEHLAGLLVSNLEHALDSAGREEQLRQREQELERKNERLNEFTSIISHDLRNPLNVASLRMELLARECDSEHVDAVRDAHDRMESLIEKTLALARQGQAAVEMEPIDLSELADGCWSMVATADGTLDVADNVVVRGDSKSLRQLLENLFRNSIEHGGPDVTVRIGSIDGGFYVEDDGTGIDPEKRGDVFEPGYSTGEEGIGFGLALVREIAGVHGWDATVTDGSEGGARFEFTGVEHVGKESQQSV